MATSEVNIDRTGAQALMPEEVSQEIIKSMPGASLALSTFRQVQMSRKQRRVPVMSVLPSAYWVSGDTGRKQTSSAEWDNIFLEAEELAVIVPIPEAVLDDADYDIWSEIRPSIAEALGAKIDLATIFGDDAPASWSSGNGLSVVESATAAGNTVERGTADFLWQDLYAEGGLWNTVEADGFNPNFALAHLGFKAALRGEADDNGRPIWTSFPSATGPQSVLADGTPIKFSENGGWVVEDADLVIGDSSKAIIGIRQDITYKMLDQAVLQNADGSIFLNLAQQDAVALRVVMRLGFATANPPNRVNTDDNTRSPFAVLTNTVS